MTGRKNVRTDDPRAAHLRLAAAFRDDAAQIDAQVDGLQRRIETLHAVASAARDAARTLGDPDAGYLLREAALSDQEARTLAGQEAVMRSEARRARAQADAVAAKGERFGAEVDARRGP